MSHMIDVEAMQALVRKYDPPTNKLRAFLVSNVPDELTRWASEVLHAAGSRVSREFAIKLLELADAVVANAIAEEIDARNRGLGAPSIVELLGDVRDCAALNKKLDAAKPIAEQIADVTPKGRCTACSLDHEWAPPWALAKCSKATPEEKGELTPNERTAIENTLGPRKSQDLTDDELRALGYERVKQRVGCIAGYVFQVRPWRILTGALMLDRTTIIEALKSTRKERERAAQVHDKGELRAFYLMITYSARLEGLQRVFDAYVHAAFRASKGPLIPEVPRDATTVRVEERTVPVQAEALARDGARRDGMYKYEANVAAHAQSRRLKALASVAAAQPAEAKPDPMKKPQVQLIRARGIAAQAWCEPETQHLTMIPELAEAFARILVRLLPAGICPGLEIEPGAYSGCLGGADCPTCGGKELLPAKDITDFNGYADARIEKLGAKPGETYVLRVPAEISDLEHEQVISTYERLKLPDGVTMFIVTEPLRLEQLKDAGLVRVADVVRLLRERAAASSAACLYVGQQNSGVVAELSEIADKIERGGA